MDGQIYRQLDRCRWIDRYISKTDGGHINRHVEIDTQRQEERKHE